MAHRILVAICILSVGAMAAADIPSPLDYLTAAEQEEARDLIPAFAKIERYLSSFPSHKVQQFMDLNPSDKLIELESTSDEDRKRNEEALKLFLALPKAAKKCNYEGYKILAQNQLAIGEDQDSKRSSAILREFHFEHAQFCRGKYIIHPQKKSDSTQDEFATARQIIADLGSSDCLFVQGLYYGLLKTSLTCTKQLIGQLKSVNQDKTGSSEADSVDAQKDLLQKYLIVPCRDHFERYKTVSAPAIYDEQIVPAESGSFGAGLLNFKACESIIKKDEALKHFIELASSAQDWDQLEEDEEDEEIL